jgi:steroid 5-alpha reductase family enzyme
MEIANSVSQINEGRIPDMNTLQQVVTLACIVLAGAGLAAAGSDGGAAVNGMPAFALCVGLAFLIQWLAFVPAYARQTEKFYDLTGSLTFITTIILAVALSPVRDGRTYLLLALVSIWVIRLGTYLFGRILAEGFDRRFDDLKPDLGKFLIAWTLQGLWVAVSLGPALAAVTSGSRRGLGALAALGACVWLLGFGIEVIADHQKQRFRADASNEGRFIDTGLWAWSRHPNYFGEITLWFGVALVALPNLHGWQWITMISPVFIYVLLTRISGIPLLEQRADERWGGRPDYETYKRRTPALFPRPPR